MHRSIVVVLVVLGLLAPASATAAPPSRPSLTDDHPARAHADRDSDGLSDALERDIAGKRADERIAAVVTFDGPGNAASAQRAVGRFDVRREFRIVPAFSAVMTVGQARALAGRPPVFRVEADFEVTTVNDANNADFGTAAARDAFSVDGAGREVCVVDTGVDPSHEQLDSKKPVAFHDAVNGRSAAYDDHGHGTHVAATAVGDGTGSQKAPAYAGVAPAADLSAAKVLDSTGSGSSSQVIAGVEWCAQRASVDVISMSLGSGASSDGRDAISQAVDQAVTTYGKVAVVAAGNSGDAPYSVGSPGAAAEAITVAAAAEWSSGESGSANASLGVHLAPWSSRGPTADDRTKPDVTAPGMSVTSARHNTTSDYVTWSGTSMATPFVAGTVALMLGAGGSRPSVKALLTDTAQDRGPTGQDHDWGFGLLDARAAVATAAGSVGGTAFPTHEFASDTVADHGLWAYEFTVTDLGTPIAATVLIDGGWTCVLRVGGVCWLYSWDGPDLDLRLKDPSGTVVDASTCPLGCHSSSIGRQETIDVMPSTTGTYRLELYPYEGDPNYGRGGAFTVDLSHGPVGMTGGGDGDNRPPTAEAITVSTDEDTPVVVTLSGTDNETCELAFSILTGPSNGTLGSVSDDACSDTDPSTDTASVTYAPDPNRFGTDSFTYAVTDGLLSATATVTLEVSSVNDSPPTAAFTWSCTDLACAFIDTSADPGDHPDGRIESWLWEFGDGSSSAAQHPSHSYNVEGDYAVTLTVTDNDGATDTVRETVTVTEPAGGTITLSASGEKVRGTKYVDLRWQGATGQSVDVFRDGARAATTANDGTYRDAAGKGGGAHTYRVCEQASSTCSNEATVRF